MPEKNKKPVLGNVTYDIAKDFATLWLPAAATLYAGLAIIWGWPFSNEVVGSVALIVTFLGVVLKISSNQYNTSTEGYDGAMFVDTSDPEVATYRLAIDASAADLASKPEVTLKINRP